MKLSDDSLVNFIHRMVARMITKLQANYKEVLYKNTAVQKLQNLNFVKVIEAAIVWKFLQPQKGEQICDVACGTGIHCIEMARRGCRAYGVDLSEASIEMAKSLAEGYDCYFRVGDAENLPFESNTFDKVVCVCALEHFDNDQNALAEMSRVIKMGGILVLTLEGSTYQGHLKEIVQEAFHVVNFYSLGAIKAKLAKASFEVAGSKSFINSSVSGFFYKLSVSLGTYRFGGELIGFLFPLAFTLSVISDRFRGTKKEGYRLAIKARKVSCEG